METHPFAERLGGDWRAEAPTFARIVAHRDAHGGFWWRCAPGHRPELVLLETAPNREGGAVWVVYGGLRVEAAEWDAGIRDEDWRVDALVCPCDGRGLPVDW